MRVLALLLVGIGGVVAQGASVLGPYLALCVLAVVVLGAVVITHRWRHHQVDRQRKELELELLQLRVRRARGAPPDIAVSPDGTSWWDGERWRPLGFWSHPNERGPEPPHRARLVERALHRMPKWW